MSSFSQFDYLYKKKNGDQNFQSESCVDDAEVYLHLVALNNNESSLNPIALDNNECSGEVAPFTAQKYAVNMSDQLAITVINNCCSDSSESDFMADVQPCEVSLEWCWKTTTTSIVELDSASRWVSFESTAHEDNQSMTTFPGHSMSRRLMLLTQIVTSFLLLPPSCCAKKGVKKLQIVILEVLGYNQSRFKDPCTSYYDLSLVGKSLPDIEKDSCSDGGAKQETCSLIEAFTAEELLPRPCMKLFANFEQSSESEDSSTKEFTFESILTGARKENRFFHEAYNIIAEELSVELPHVENCADFEVSSEFESDRPTADVSFSDVNSLVATVRKKNSLMAFQYPPVPLKSTIVITSNDKHSTSNFILVTVMGAGKPPFSHSSIKTCLMPENINPFMTSSFVSMLVHKFLLSTLTLFLVLVELVVDILRLLSALCNLMLLAGDVETNPGPQGHTCQDEYIGCAQHVQALEAPKDIFVEQVEGRSTVTVLLSGKTGAGKSSLIWELCREWEDTHVSSKTSAIIKRSRKGSLSSNVFSLISVIGEDYVAPNDMNTWEEVNYEISPESDIIYYMLDAYRDFVWCIVSSSKNDYETIQKLLKKETVNNIDITAYVQTHQLRKCASPALAKFQGNVSVDEFPLHIPLHSLLLKHLDHLKEITLVADAKYYVMPCILLEALLLEASHQDYCDPSFLPARLFELCLPVKGVVANLHEDSQTLTKNWFHEEGDYEDSLVSTSKGYDILYTTCHSTPVHEVCSEIRSRLESAIKTLTSRLNYISSDKCKLMLECPSHPRMEHMCVVSRIEPCPHLMLCSEKPKAVKKKSSVWLKKPLIAAISTCTSTWSAIAVAAGMISAGTSFLEENQSLVLTNNTASDVTVCPLDYDLNEKVKKLLEKLKGAVGSEVTFQKFLEILLDSGRTPFAEAVCVLGKLLIVAVIASLLRFLLVLLLLLSGDVETNPGPTNSSEKADFGDLVTIPGVDAKWEALGVALKLDHDALTKIRAKHSGHLKCKREMFRLVVKGGATWRNIIKALCDVGLAASARSVCETYDIYPNGLSSYISWSEHDSVEADCATPSTEVKSFSTSMEFQTFQSTRGDLVSEITRDPIILANAVFSRGIITQENLYELRGVSTDHNKAVKLVSLIEATLQEHPYKFEAFASALRSISTHVALADKVSQLYRFNRVCNKMKNTEERRLDMNYLSAELNNSRLISDNTRIKAAGAANFVDMCSVIFADLQTKGLGEPYLALLDSFSNTKEVCATLRELYCEKNEAKPGERIVMESSVDRDVLNSTASNFPEKKSEHEGTLVVKSPISSPPYSGESFQVRMQSPDMESDPYLSADSSRMSAPHRDDNSEFHSPEAIVPHIGSEELTLRHSTNVMGGVNVVSGVNADSGFSTLNRSSPTPTVTKSAASALSSATSKSAGDTLVASDNAVAMVTTTDKKEEKPVKKDQGRGPKSKVQHDKFRAALKRLDISQVDSLLSKEAADVEHLFEPDQQTALMLAAIEGNKDMVRTLLQHGASVVTRDQDGCTALYLAASNGNYEAVKILAQQQLADVNIQNKDGEPLLMEPVRKGFSMVTELLVQYGAKVDVESTDGETPIYVAVRKGNFDVVKVLLDSNADFTKESKKTLRTPLEEALEGDDTEIVRLLMKAVARVNEKSQELFTCKTRDHVKHLIKKGAKINTRNSDEATPLLIHTQQGNTEVVKELIHQRANVDLQDRHGYSALNVAAKNGCVELVQLLVKNGAILDLKESKNGYTALMFAIEKGYVHIGKELILAKANVNIRNRDGKSSLDLAREHGNTDVLEVLNMQPTTSTGNDPFVNILSGYMLGKGRGKKNGASNSTGKGSTPSLPKIRAIVAAKAPYVPEEDSAHVEEVKKYQKRIADLETRIHDLTILGTMDIADENDLTYMERGRLETEFRKLKESKKKAEQYAVEAKQTAQRLSAENFKLREDLSKERHFNELTRKNMMREVELSIERKDGHAKTMEIRSEVFDEEVAKRAFLGKQSSSLYRKVKFTSKQIKDVIMERRVCLDLFHLVIGGLPYSGKTTLVNSIFDLPQLQKPTEGTFDIDLHEAIIHKNRLSGEHDWFESSKLQANIHTIIAALAYFFAKEHQLPILDLKDMKQFDDPEIQRYFETTCSCLESLVHSIDDGTKVEKMLSGSLSLMNVFDVGVNRAVYEFMMAVEGKNKHLLFINVLDLVQSDKDTMKKPLNLGDPRYGGKYRGSQVSLLKNRSALHHFVSFTEAASHAKPSDSQAASNTLIVGTHADQFHSHSECAEREKEVMKLLKSYDTVMGHTSNASSPNIVTVDATNMEDCKQVREQLLMLVDSNKAFNVDIPVKFIFLRYVLFCTKKVHMSRKEVMEYAKKCGITDESEFDEFLDIFRNCASIISSEDKEFLYYHVILLPIDFLRDLNKLYCIEDERNIPSELKEPVKFGMVSERVLRALWQGSDDHMLTWEFFVDVLKTVLLLMDLGAGKFFCPSLRLEHCDVPLRPGSLIISSSAAFTSFSGMQCAFVKHLTSHHKDVRLDEECPFYNCVEFLSKSGEKEGRVTIRFFHDFIEVFVDPSSISPSHAANLYSMLKTDCVAIMNEISKERYQFCVVCPKSKVELNDNHFIPFDILEATAHNLRCTMCKSEVDEVKGVHWIKAAYQGSRKAALKADDLLDPNNVLKICKDDLSSLTIQEIEKLSKTLAVPDKFKATSHASVDEVLFHVLYCWHHKNPTATKRKLALLLKESGLYKQAVAMDPNLLVHTYTSEKATTFSSKEVIILASSWTEDPKELAEVLEMPVPDHEEGATDTDKCSSMLQLWLDQTEGDRREKLASKFEQKEYYTMAGFISEL